MTQNLLDDPDVAVVNHVAWQTLKDAVEQLRPLQSADGSIAVAAGPDGLDLVAPGPDGLEPLARAAELTSTVIECVRTLAPRFPHDAAYLDAVVHDLTAWADGGFGKPDFLDSLLAFSPQLDRVDGREHLVVFSMYTQNGNPDRNLEAVLLHVVWPDWIAEIEAGDYGNRAFVPVAFVDFTSGYDTNSAVLFPETIAVREVPVFTWGAIF